MKKNININLFGTLYAIDEDACKLLENYLENMRSYFAHRDGGDEIADDIEHRVAEHLWTLKEQGLTAIDITVVKSVIESIGNPAQVDGETDESGTTVNNKAEASQNADCSDAEASDSASQSDTGRNASDSSTQRLFARIASHVGTHRFYRDGKDKIAGGVMSGLCHYCGGGDTLVWRVSAVLLVIMLFFINRITRFLFFHSLTGVMFFLPFILYISLWLLAPVARTAGERLCMKGDEVTPESLGRAVIAEAGEAEKAKTVRRRQVGILGRIVEIVLFCIKASATVAFAVMSAFALAYLVCGIIYAVAGEPFLQIFDGDPEFIKAIVSTPMLGLYWILSAVCCLAASLLPLFGVVRTFKQDRKPLRLASTVTLVVTWVVAVVIGILMFVLFGIHISHEKETMYVASNTRNGIFLQQWTWMQLDRNGWKVSAAKNIASGQMYEPDSNDPLCLGTAPMNLQPKEAGRPVELAMSRSESVEAGDYVLECMADCSLSDATLSVWSGDACLAQLRLDGYGAAVNRQLDGTSWADSRTLPLFSNQSDSTVWAEDVMSDGQDEYGNSSHNAGRDWRYLTTARFHYSGGVIEYRLRIGCHDVKGGSAVCGRMLLAHIGLRKQ